MEPQEIIATAESHSFPANWHVWTLRRGLVFREVAWQTFISVCGFLLLGYGLYATIPANTAMLASVAASWPGRATYIIATGDTAGAKVENRPSTLEAACVRDRQQVAEGPIPAFRQSIAS